MSALLKESDPRLEHIVDELCRERQEMLVMFCRVAGLEPLSPSGMHVEMLQDFCQLLIDYAALSHFELFDRLARETELEAEVRAEVARIFSGVVRTTEAALEFNDKYASGGPAPDNDSLSQDLSALGAVLAERAELEDRLIARVYQR